MNSSSAQETYLITLDDTLNSTLTTANTVTIDNSMFSGSYTIASGSISTISPLDTVTISSLDSSNWSFNLPIEWVDSFPSYSEVEKMCKEYPALKIAFEKFKQTYSMVEDDWEAKKGNKYAT